MKVFRKDIHLPHINYTIRIRPLSNRKRVKPSDNFHAWTERNNRSRCTIYLPQNCAPSMLAHELVHALRYIVLDRHMIFENEFEHMAYIMQYAMGDALGFVWGKSE